jgi:hypothetical protein
MCLSKRLVEFGSELHLIIRVVTLEQEELASKGKHWASRCHSTGIALSQLSRCRVLITMLSLSGPCRTDLPTGHLSGNPAHINRPIDYQSSRDPATDFINDRGDLQTYLWAMSCVPSYLITLKLINTCLFGGYPFIWRSLPTLSGVSADMQNTHESPTAPYSSTDTAHSLLIQLEFKHAPQQTWRLNHTWLWARQISTSLIEYTSKQGTNVLNPK